jgi:hypothetical protein
MGHELPIGIIKFVFWDMGYMHHLIRGIITFKWATKNSINNYQNLEVFLILGGPISSSKYQWEKPWFGVPIFWETPGMGCWAPFAPGGWHPTPPRNGSAPRQRTEAPAGSSSLWGKFFENDRTENLVQKTVVNWDFSQFTFPCYVTLRILASFLWCFVGVSGFWTWHPTKRAKQGELRLGKHLELELHPQTHSLAKGSRNPKYGSWRIQLLGCHFQWMQHDVAWCSMM